jgi:hypothetical protein
MTEYEGGSPLPSDIAQLLRSEREYSDAIPSKAQASLARRLSVPLGASGLHAIGHAARSHAAKKALLGSWTGAAVKGVIVLAASGGVYVGIHRAAKTSEPAALEVAVPTLPPTTVSAATATTEPQPSALAGPLVVVTRALPPVVSAPPKADDPARVAEEHRILDEARDAIVRGEPVKALDATAAHASRFPRGTLAEERYAIRIRALARLGRKAEAESILADMRAHYPHSFLLEGAAADVDGSAAGGTSQTPTVHGSAAGGTSQTPTVHGSAAGGTSQTPTVHGSAAGGTSQTPTVHGSAAGGTSGTIP